jgi:predicted  nucleic acid-binding Zn-ribbon protein
MEGEKTNTQLEAELQELKEQNTMLKANLDAAKQEVKEATELNDELQNQLDKKQPDSNTPSVEINGKVYYTRHKALRLSVDKTISAEELVADVDMCKKLVAEGNGMLREKKKAEVKK